MLVVVAVVMFPVCVIRQDSTGQNESTKNRLGGKVTLFYFDAFEHLIKITLERASSKVELTNGAADPCHAPQAIELLGIDQGDHQIAWASHKLQALALISRPRSADRS